MSPEVEAERERIAKALLALQRESSHGLWKYFLLRIVKDVVYEVTEADD